MDSQQDKSKTVKVSEELSDDLKLLKAIELVKKNRRQISHNTISSGKISSNNKSKFFKDLPQNPFKGV